MAPPSTTQHDVSSDTADLTQPRKAVSWAENLEQVHVLEETQFSEDRAVSRYLKSLYQSSPVDPVDEARKATREKAKASSNSLRVNVTCRESGQCRLVVFNTATPSLDELRKRIKSKLKIKVAHKKLHVVINVKGQGALVDEDVIEALTNGCSVQVTRKPVVRECVTVSAVKESDNSAAEESGKSAAEESDKPAAEESDKPAAEESDKSAAEESDKSAAEESDKPAAEESDKPAAEESDKSAVEESDKSAAEESDKSAAEESDKPAAEESDKSAVEETSESSA